MKSAEMSYTLTKDGYSLDVEQKPERRLSIAEFSAAIGVSKTKLRAMDKDGTLPPAGRTEGGHRYYTIKQAMDYVSSLPQIHRGTETSVITLGSLATLIPAGVKIIVGECRNRALKSSRIWCLEGTDDEDAQDYIEQNADCEVLQIGVKLEHKALHIKIRKV